ncbi:MAG: pyrroline-5-carboxylate reductase [Armatimonadota bacterium]|nr:pyrroline-5-carboxylate reductase [Armatimonadota bacterium]
MNNHCGKLTVIGAGAMGYAFAEGVIRQGLCEPKSVTVSDIDASKLSFASTRLGVSTTHDNKEAVKGARVILIAVKPSVVPIVLNEIRDALQSDQLLISIAAGVRLAAIESRLPPQSKVIRAMPNIACKVGRGAIAYARGSVVEEEDVKTARTVLEAVGLCVEVPENLMNAVTGLSGSGPAYVFVLIESLADAGVRLGLPRDTALTLAAQTVLGSAHMVIGTAEHPAKLKDLVASPGGTTIAGLDALEHAGFRSAIIDAVKAAAARADELG